MTLNIFLNENLLVHTLAYPTFWFQRKWIHPNPELSSSPARPRPGWCTIFFWLFEHPPRCILTMKERETNERAQSRSTPTLNGRSRWVGRRGLNGISVNASFEWIFDCVVYDWIYFLPAGEFFVGCCCWLRRNFANPSYIFICTKYSLFFF